MKVDTEAAHGGEDRDHADPHAAPADAEDGEIAHGGEDRELDDPRALEVEAGADNELAHRGEVCEQGGPHALEVEAEVDERVQVGEHVEQKVVLLQQTAEDVEGEEGHSEQADTLPHENTEEVDGDEDGEPHNEDHREITGEDDDDELAPRARL